MSKDKFIPCIVCDKPLKLYIDKDCSFVEHGGIKFRDKCVGYGSKFEYDDISIAVCDNCLYKHFLKHGTKIKNTFIGKKAVSYHNYKNDKYILVDKDMNILMTGNNIKQLQKYIKLFKKQAEYSILPVEVVS